MRGVGWEFTFFSGGHIALTNSCLALKADTRHGALDVWNLAKTSAAVRALEGEVAMKSQTGR